MPNIWTLMLFAHGQTQAIVLQYDTLAAATCGLELVTSVQFRVTLCDDYGRVLLIRPDDVQILMLQDIDRATEGNAVATVKNAISQQLIQIRAEQEKEANPEIKSFVMKQQLTQGVPRSSILS